MTNETEHKILIVGAGPTGLVLALELARRNIPFRIIEARSGPGQASRAIAVHARTLEFYQQLGIADEVVAQGTKGESLHMREHGKDMVRLNFKDMGAGISPFPFVLTYAQDDHERYLISKLAELNINIEWNTELKRLSQSEHEVTATLRTQSGEEVFEAIYVAGCDGARSRVREELKMEFAGGTDPHLFYVADVKIDSEFESDIIINLDPQTLELMFPVRSSGMQRLIGIVADDVATKKDLNFEDVRGKAEALLGVRVTEVNWFSTYHVHHRVAPHFRVGRCFVLGDAGHIHSPVGGQGMNTGIGDAVNLAWKLAAVFKGRAAETILDTYEAERIVFARSLVATTDKAFQFIVNQKYGNHFLRMWLFPHILKFATSFALVRKLFFMRLSQVLINYRMSALSLGRAGQVAGGDRLPWVPIGMSDNFASLKNLCWQVHIYGKTNLKFKADLVALNIEQHEFEWTGLAQKAGLAQDAVYLIRPDGYVALASSTQDIEQIRAYAKKFTIDFSPYNI